MLGTEVGLHAAQVPVWEGVLGLVETERGTGAQGRGQGPESPGQEEAGEEAREEEEGN